MERESGETVKLELSKWRESGVGKEMRVERKSRERVECESREREG